jgi:hypothetical protein
LAGFGRAAAHAGLLTGLAGVLGLLLLLLSGFAGVLALLPVLTLLLAGLVLPAAVALGFVPVTV